MRTKSPVYDWLTAKQTDVTGPLSRRSWGGMRDKPKNICVGGYFLFLSFISRNALCLHGHALNIYGSFIK